MSSATVAPKPAALGSIPYDNIPFALKSDGRWVLWCWELRDDKWTKVPYVAQAKGRRRADTTDPLTWHSFGAARTVLELGGYDGLGHVFSEDGGMVGMDLDKCRDAETGQINEEARAIIDSLNSYTEVSPSGTGVKIFTFGSLPLDMRRVDSEGRISGGKKISPYEMYGYDRFFTVTGQHLVGTPLTVEEREGELHKVYWQVFPAPCEDKPPWSRPARSIPRSQAFTVAQIMERLSKIPKCRALLAGDISAYGDDDSRADLALLWYASRFTDDASDLDEILRLSGLYRPKWERRDYRDRTINKALHSVGVGAWLESNVTTDTEPPGFFVDGDEEACSETAAAQDTGLLRRISVLELKLEILFSPEVKQPGRTLIVFVEEALKRVNEGAIDELGRIYLPQVNIARRLQMGASTVGDHLNLAEVMGLCQRSVVKKPNPNSPGRWLVDTYFRLPSYDLVELLTIIRDFRRPPEKPNWGGARVKGCPKHPDATIVERRYCGVCGEVVGVAEIDPKTSKRKVVYPPAPPKRKKKSV